MDRLPYNVCEVYYKALGLEFENYNPAQHAALSGSERFPLIVGGERGGKSWATAALFVPHIDLLPSLRPAQFYKPDGKLKWDFNNKSDRPMTPNFVLFGPTYTEPRVEFSYIEEWLRQLDMVERISKPGDGPWRLITKKGVVLSTFSTENPSSIRAIDVDGAAACEAGNMSYDAIERIQGRIGAKKGFLVYSGTLENAERWYINMALEGEREALQNKWRVKTYKIPSWANLHEFPGGRQDPEILRWEEFYTNDTFLVRVAAEPQPPKERVIKEANEDHIRKVKLPRDEDGGYACEFSVCVDPGYMPSAYSVLFVAHWDTPEGKFWYVFDELYAREITNVEAIEWLRKHKFWRHIPNDGITIDAAVKRHADGNEPGVRVYQRLTGKTPKYKYWHENGLIERLRTTFKSNLVAIHPNCTGFIAELGLGEPPRKIPDMHPWKYHTDKDNAIIINDKPIDKHNHSSKAFGYLLLRHLGLVERMGDAPEPKRRLQPKPGALMEMNRYSLMKRRVNI